MTRIVSAFAALAVFSSSAVYALTFNLSPDTVLTAGQSVELRCSVDAAVPVRWRVVEPANVAGVTFEGDTLRISGREALTALGGGTHRNGRAVCEANGESSSPVTVDFIDDAQMADLVIPQAMLDVAARKQYGFSDVSREALQLIGIVDPLPLPSMAVRRYSAAAYLTDVVVPPVGAFEADSIWYSNARPEGFWGFRLDAALPTENDVTANVAMTGYGSGRNNFTRNLQGTYRVEFKATRESVPVKGVPLVPQNGNYVFDARLAESYPVAATAKGEVLIQFHNQTATEQSGLVETRSLGGGRPGDSLNIVCTADYCTAEHRIIRDSYSVKLRDLVRSHWLTMTRDDVEGIEMLALYQVQGSARIGVSASGRVIDDTVTLASPGPAYAVVYLVLRDRFGAIAEQYLDIEFQ